MEVRPRELLAACVAIAALFFGVLAFTQPPVDWGLVEHMSGTTVVVDEVRMGSPAWLAEIQPGEWISQEIRPDLSYLGPDAQGNAVDGVIDITNPDGSAYGIWLGTPDQARQDAIVATFLGIALLLGGWFLLRRSDGSMRPFAASLPVAVAAPLVMVPLARLANMSGLATTAVLLPLTQVPFALDVAMQLPRGKLRAAVLLLLAVLSIAGGVYLFWLPVQYWSRLVGIGLVAAMSFIPALVLAAQRRFEYPADESATASGRVLRAGGLIAAGVTPGIALVAYVDKASVILWPIVVWLLAIFIARTVTLDPLMRLASRATLQRDVLVAATEAERARIAADIHDEVLQDMTMLVRRLDAGGDDENAEAAREIAGRLRAICGELRLPILDDLGVGPALDWLVERNEELAGGPVYLERLEDEPRMPAPVELALFRIAQEALTNAIRHGKPPIVVRFRSGGTWAELDVDDAGAGVPDGAGERAEQSGHYGLLNMAQRAEQVGAEFRLGRRPGGGTRVSVVWEAAGEGDAIPLQHSPEPAPGPAR